MKGCTGDCWFKPNTRHLVSAMLLLLLFLQGQLALAAAPEWKRITVSTSALEPASVFAADIDGDGWMDLASASYVDNKIAWYRNMDGRGTFDGPQRIVSRNGVEAGEWSQRTSTGTAGWTWRRRHADNKIAWYRNMDGRGTFDGPQRIVSRNAAEATSVVAADIDGDGWMDLASVSK